MSDESSDFKSKLNEHLAVLNHHDQHGLDPLRALGDGLQRLYEDTTSSKLPTDFVELLAELDSA